jgi:hypothetical protein
VTKAAIYAKNHAFEMGYDRDFNQTLFSMIYFENKSSAAVALRFKMIYKKQTKEINHAFDIYSMSGTTWLTQHGT